MMTYEVQGKLMSSLVSEVELKKGESSIPGGVLKSFEATLKNELVPIHEEKVFCYPIHSKKEVTFFYLNKKTHSPHLLSYDGAPILNKLHNEEIVLHFFACMISSVLLITVLYFLVYFIRLRPFPIKTATICGLVLLWMGYHLLVNWPGVLGFDGILNYYGTFDLDISSFIQPLTILLNSALFNFIPHYAWNSVVTIALMTLAFGLMTYYIGRDKKVFYLFLILMTYFFYSPLNIYTNLFISRDSIFSWLFFIATIFPVIIALSRTKKSIKMHFCFLLFFFLAIEIRKEVVILFPFALWWSYRTLDYSKMKKNIMYAGFFSAILLSFFGSKNFEKSISAPYYQAVNLINPIGEILSVKGLHILEEQEKAGLKGIIDWDKLTKNYIRYDLSPETMESLNTEMTHSDLLQISKLYLRLMKDYPLLWLENRLGVMFGSMGLNELRPNYANDILTEMNIPIFHYFNLHSMPYTEFNISYPEILTKWKFNHWDGRNQLSWNRYLLLSFAIPLLLTFCCLPYLKSAPATALALFFNIARLITIMPFMPASYIKYNYSAYLLFLFLPILLIAEKRKKPDLV